MFQDKFAYSVKMDFIKVVKTAYFVIIQNVPLVKTKLMSVFYHAILGVKLVQFQMFVILVRVDIMMMEVVHVQSVIILVPLVQAQLQIVY